MTASATNTTRTGPSRHRILVPTLITIGLIGILLSTVSAWLRDSALDSGVWGDESGQLLQKQSVRSLVAAYVVDQAVTHTDAQSRIASSLPPRLQPLAAPATAAIARFATQATEDALALPRVQQLWVTANTQTHQQLVDFLEGKTTRLQASNGEVQLNLAPIVANVAATLGVNPQAAAQKAQSIPPITILRSNQLSTVQTMIEWIRLLSIWPLVIGVILLAVAVYLAHGWRREALRGTAVGFLLMGFFLLAGRRIGGGVLVDSLVKTDSVRQAANDSYDIYTSLLRDSAMAGVAIGLVGLLGTFLAGPTRAATSLRARVAPTVRDHPLWAHAALALLTLIVLATSPAGTPRRAGGLVLLVVLAFVGLEVLRRQAVRELAAGGPGQVVGSPVDEVASGTEESESAETSGRPA
jgi:hypothetical protein